MQNSTILIIVIILVVLYFIYKHIEKKNAALLNELLEKKENDFNKRHDNLVLKFKNVEDENERLKKEIEKRRIEDFEKQKLEEKKAELIRIEENKKKIYEQELNYVDDLILLCLKNTNEDNYDSIGVIQSTVRGRNLYFGGEREVNGDMVTTCLTRLVENGFVKAKTVFPLGTESIFSPTANVYIITAKGTDKILKHPLYHNSF